MKRLVTGIAIGVVAGLLVGGGFVWATVPDSSTGGVTACYPTSGPSQGALRVIDAENGETCGAGEQQLALGSEQCAGYPRGGVDWHNCDLHKAYLNAQFLEGANLSGANLAGANLTRANLASSNLAGANLSGASLGLASLQGAVVTGASFTNARLSSYSNTVNAGPGWTRLAGAVGFTSAMLRSVTQSTPHNSACSYNTGLTGPDLRYIAFGSMNLTGADLHDAHLWNSRLPLAKLSSVNFSNTDMTSVDITAANLSNANLTCALATDLKLVGANFTNANFTNANIQGSPGLTPANVVGAIWSNTTCPDNTNSDANGGTCIGHL